jgi:hypothetical protein
VPIEGGEKMPWSFVVQRLTTARNFWVATVRPDGRPHAAPIWGVFVEDDLYLETDPGTVKARNLAADPRVNVHPELADEVVIVEGLAEPFRPDEHTAAALAVAFASKYVGYEPEPEAWDAGGLYVVTPETVLAWRDMPTATRWRFGRSRPQPE